MILFILGTLTLLVFLAWGTWRTAVLLRTWTPTTNLILLPAENVLRLGLILVCVLLARISGLSEEQFGWNTDDLERSIRLGLSVGVVTAFLIPSITHLAIRRFGAGIYSPVVVRSILPRDRLEWLLVPLAFVPAVLLEELLFRSLLLGGFGAFAWPTLLAVFWSVLFGVMHQPQGLLGMVVAALLGGLLSALFLVSGSLIAPTIAHYVINLMQWVWASHERGWLETYDRGSDS